MRGFRKRTLADKLDALEKAVRALRASWSNGDPAKLQLEAVLYAEARLREVRAVARGNERKEKRACCLHPEKHRCLDGRCGKCGKGKLDSAPARVLCVCGHQRARHGTDDAERCVTFHMEPQHNCLGFKPASHSGVALLQEGGRA